ncbi:MAG: hypothetical protein N838_30310 [Thiohalocapsa sp. PB-PSB1]|nr:MAG: hypothetical protein N838_30310 [Thiohalocapsa sp. PB-PSB1]
MRPILLTSITTTLGLLPMALGISRCSLVWASMASISSLVSLRQHFRLFVNYPSALGPRC